LPTTIRLAEKLCGSIVRDRLPPTKTRTEDEVCSCKAGKERREAARLRLDREHPGGADGDETDHGPPGAYSNSGCPVARMIYAEASVRRSAMIASHITSRVIDEWHQPHLGSITDSEK